MVVTAIQAMAQMCSHSNSKRTPILYTVPKILRMWMAPAEAANLCFWVLFLSPCLLHDLKKKLFLLISQRKRVVASQEQSHHLLHGKDVVNNDADVESGVWNRFEQLEAALQLVTYLYSDHIASAILTNALHTIQEGWTNSAQYNQHTHKYPARLKFFLSSVSNAVGVTRHLPIKSFHCCKACGLKDVLHIPQVCREVVHIQSCTVYDYCSTCSQPWKIKHDS